MVLPTEIMLSATESAPLRPEIRNILFQDVEFRGRRLDGYESPRLIIRGWGPQRPSSPTKAKFGSGNCARVRCELKRESPVPG